MFGLSTDFVTKGKLASVKEIRVLVESLLESLYGGQFTFSYHSADKVKIHAMMISVKAILAICWDKF